MCEVFLPFDYEPVWTLRKIDFIHHLKLAIGAKFLGLLSHDIHEFRAHDSLRKPRIVFYFGRDGQLTTGLWSFKD